MIIAVGVDIVEVARIEEAMKNLRFLERILTPSELKLATNVQFVAGRWAVKEAVAKAVSVRLTWQDVEILPDENGRPTAHVKNASFNSETDRLHVSISHERGHAVGLAIFESVSPSQLC